MVRPDEIMSEDPVARLLNGYKRLPGVPDELIGPDGGLRPVWTEFFPALAAMSGDELETRKARGDRYLRDAGVFFRQYGPNAPTERDWPLSHMPVLIGEDEWASIEAGLRQRADLLERVVADLYGENRLVADGHLPPELVASNREWLRPLVGIEPRGGKFLHFLAFDIGRGPSGDWWVIGDRLQAPSGAGFALENRIATARIFSDHYSRLNVHRLAGFFRTYREALYGLRASEDRRIAVLTPGPMNDTYYEHAYLARYLGLMLLEGEDLTVRNGELMVRTVAGLQPVGVLWRRLDANWVDPLELEQTSRLGTPGMVDAVRAGSVTMVNALGSGVLETRAFLAFLPRIAEALTGEALAMPNIATWWCGQAPERDFVKANAERMTISDAFATTPLFERDDRTVVGGRIDLAASDTLDAFVDRGVGALVGQETITLSTTPAFDGARLVPRPMSLRVFVGRTPHGWEIMPGGLARIGRSADTAELAMQKGGSTADIWVVSRNPVPRTTMLPSASEAVVRQRPGELPSRAADNLYWLGRYVERAENAIRLTRAYHLRLSEASSVDTDLLDVVSGHLDRLGVGPDGGFPAGLRTIFKSAAYTASRVRERFSVDGWNALSDLEKTVTDMTRTAKPGDDMAGAMSVLLRKISGFSGLVHDNMYRFTGWRFLSIGKALERAGLLCSLLIDLCDAAAPDGGFEFALEAADSAQSHRRRYAVSTRRETVIDLLALDPLNPRSVINQLNAVEEHVGYLPNADLNRQLSPLQRAVLETRTRLAARTPDTLTTDVLVEIRSMTARLSDELGLAYFR
jgi:uncharacterized circularly permuted ATP-grasp superfamily protein/uncharacterized alpha-E superfamily protein